MSAIIREVTIGDCRLIQGDERRKHRAKGHKKALRLYPEIGPCVKCGNEKSERHHVDDNPHNNSPDNIMPLCRRCHTLEHGKTLTPEAIRAGVEAAAIKRRAITHCRRGHPYSGNNLYTDKQGKRHCRACNRLAQKRRKEKKNASD